MELACTKKLLEYVGVKAERMTAEIDPLFEWTANMTLEMDGPIRWNSAV